MPLRYGHPNEVLKGPPKAGPGARQWVEKNIIIHMWLSGI